MLKGVNQQIRREIKRKIYPLKVINGMDLSYMNLSGLDMRGCKICDSNLSGVKMRKTNLQGATITRSDLSNSILIDSNLTYVNFSESNMQGSNMKKAILRKANFTNADLSRSNLHDVLVDNNTNFTLANLTNAIMDEKRIRSSIIEGAIIKPANFYDRFSIYFSRKRRECDGEIRTNKIVPI